MSKPREVIARAIQEAYETRHLKTDLWLEMADAVIDALDEMEMTGRMIDAAMYCTVKETSAAGAATHADGGPAGRAARHRSCRIGGQAVSDVRPMTELEIKMFGEISKLRIERDELAEFVQRGHCKDCCCARAWEALGVAAYTGMSIPEHIERLRAELVEARRDAERWRKLQTMKASEAIAGIRENAMTRRGAAPPFGLAERVDAAIDAARGES